MKIQKYMFSCCVVLWMLLSTNLAVGQSPHFFSPELSPILRGYINDEDWEFMIDDSPNGLGYCQYCGQYAVSKNTGICSNCQHEYGDEESIGTAMPVEQGDAILYAAVIAYSIFLLVRNRKRRNNPINMEKAE